MHLHSVTKLAILLALLFGVLSCSHEAERSNLNETVIYDGYRWGIHEFELTIAGEGGEASYTLRKKDLEKNQWEEAVISSPEEVVGDKRFYLAGSIVNFPAGFASLSQIDWSAPQAIGWPDLSTTYVRHREITEEINGLIVKAHYWGAHDASKPMDFVIGNDNTVIAAIDVATDSTMVRRGYEKFTTVSEWRDSSLSQPLYGYRPLDLAMVPTKAGPRLATRVYLPQGDIKGPFPTIFIRTPYGITNMIERYKQYPIRGYAVVFQAAQGTHYRDPESRSEGDYWKAMVQEPADGADALNWIVDQPWSNGSVCMQGLSYYGYTQWTLSMAQNPALKCLIPEVSMGTAFSDQPYMGGTFVQGLAYYQFGMHGKKILPGRTWTDILRHRPLIDMDEYATGEDIEVWNNFFKHWRNDEFWKVQDWYQGDHDRNFGTFQISGWFDDDYPGTRSNWALMVKKGTRPNRLLLGPWKHVYNLDRKLNGYSYGIDALRDDVWLIKQRWYDYYLKGVENGVTDPVVEYFVLGANEWRTADTWPPSEVKSQSWFFHSTGVANSHPIDGQLSLGAPKKEEVADTYFYDPKNPVTNWYSFDLMERWEDTQSFQYDFKDIEGRHDLATYTSAQLEEDVTIAGNIKVILYASTDVKDTDWWVYVSDVTPDNASHRLSVGALRARFRKLEDTDYHVFGSNFETEELLSGDIKDVVRYEISIPSIANTFKKGNRIRIAVMNAHDNYSFPNSNTGGDEGYVTETVVGEMQIHHTPDYPSHVILPVLPKSK